MLVNAITVQEVKAVIPQAYFIAPDTSPDYCGWLIIGFLMVALCGWTMSERRKK